ncbi:MAG: hypothetical protein ACI38Q_07670 [Candidatus Bruticola sp.]
MSELRWIENFKSSRDSKKLNEVIEGGGIVACVFQAGCLLLCRADRQDVVTKLAEWHGKKRVIHFCAAELKEAWQIWKDNSDKADINNFLSYLYLDLTVLICTAAPSTEEWMRIGSAKAAVWIGQRGTVNSILRSVKRRLAGTFLKLDEEGREGRLLEGQFLVDIVKAETAGCDLIIGSSLNGPVFSQEKFIADLSSADWRVIQRGIYSLRELKSYTKRRWILSGEFLSTNKFNRLSLTNVVLCLGKSERLSSRISHLYENLRNPKEIVFFISSECVHEALHETTSLSGYEDEFNEIYPLFDVKRLHEEEYLDQRRQYLSEQLKAYRLNEDITTVCVEINDEKLGGSFLEQVQNCADRVVRFDVPEHWEDGDG